MNEQDFEVRIGECTIKCNKEYAMSVSGLIFNFLRTNPDAQYIDIKLSYFSEKQDKDFVYQILNENENVTLLPGREIFFRYFCTEMDIRENRKASVQISSIIDHNESLDILITCEEKLINISATNFDSTYLFIIDSDKNVLSSENKYSIAHLILNCCFARSFKIEMYMKLLYLISKYDQEKIEKNKLTEPSFFESFMNCFSLELSMAFRSSADYQFIDEIVFILHYFFENSKFFISFITNKVDEQEPTDFLNAYYKGEYNMISFNSLKPLFIEFVPITDFDVDLIMNKYSERYDEINQDNFFLHKCHAHEGLNGDKLARLIIYDKSEKLESILLQSYRYMKENSLKIQEENEQISNSNSSISSLSNNNNFSVEYEIVRPANFGDNSFSSLSDSSESIILQDITFDENDIKKIASKFASSQFYSIKKSIYERCSLLNKGCTLLEYAAFHGSIKCFEMLLKHKKNQKKNNDDDFYLDLNINNGLARFAVAGGSREIIDLILKEINNSDLESYDNPVQFSNMLEIAIKFHRFDIAEWLIEKMNNKFKYHPEFLNYCIQFNNMKMLRYLIKNRIYMGDDFLLNCCQYGNFCLAEWALSFSTKVSVNLVDNDLQTSILHWACLLNNKPLLLLILQHRKENKNIAYNTTGKNSKFNNIDNTNYYVNQNLDFGIAINAKCGHFYYDSTALHLVVENNNYEFAKIILDEGILKNCKNDQSDIFGSLDIEIKNRNTMTPFHIACKNGNSEIIKLFLNHKDYNVDINAETFGVFFIKIFIN